MVARWYIFKSKIQVWVTFGGSCNTRCWYLLWSFGFICPPFGIFCGHLVYVWYAFSHFWYVVPRKIWQPWTSRERDHFNDNLESINSFSLKATTLHSYTLAGFDLTTNRSASKDDTTMYMCRPRRRA
jgi:hypothetical protein